MLYRLDLSNPNFSPYISIPFFQGRIYNQAHLSQLLGCKSSHNAPLNILIKCYQRWGDLFTERLRGQFAFILIDGRAQKVLCFRDHFGIQPFYYHWAPYQRLIASTHFEELRSVLKHLTPDEDYLREMLSFGLCAEHKYLENTRYQQIKKLRPSHLLIIQQQKIKTVCYWKIQELSPLVLKRRCDYVDLFRENFYQAVQRSMQPYNKIAIEVSGGLDSACIAAVATQTRFHQLIALTNTVPAQQRKEFKTFKSEYHYAKKICDTLQIKQHTFRHEYDIFETIQKHKKDLPGFLESGFALFNTPLYQIAQQNKCQAVLSGFGGDQLVSEEGDFLLAELKQDHLFFAYCWEYLLRYNLFQIAGKIVKKLFIQPPPKQLKEHRKLLRDCLKDEVKFHFDTHSLKRYQFNSQRTYTDLFFPTGDLSGFIASRAEHCTLISAAYQLEMCFPMLDIDLVECCYRCPTSVKSFLGKGRYLLRRAMKGRLPASILERVDKTAHTVPAQMIHINDAFLKAARDAAFQASFSQKLGPYLDPAILFQYAKPPLSIIVTNAFINSVLHSNP